MMEETKNEDDVDAGEDFSKCDQFKFVPPPEAFVFRPDEEDFKDPIAYIRMIRPVAEQCGICRIVPPANWRPPFSVDMKQFTFSARVQHLKELEATTRVKLLFLQNLSEFWRLRGSPMKIPIVEGKMLDLNKIHTLVEEMGGFSKSWTKKQWRLIADSLGLSDTVGVECRVAVHYETIIFPYITFLKEEAAGRPAPMNGKIEHLELKAFCQRLLTFWRRLGVRIQWPLINKRTVDLFMLYHLVEKEGKDIDWRRVSDAMGFNDIKNGAGSLKHCFDSIVRPFIEGEAEQSLESLQLCVVCGDRVTATEMRMCRECRVYCHSKCMTTGRPKPVPIGKWTCDLCISAKLKRPKEPYGFQQSDEAYTLKQFGQQAVKFKEKHFGLDSLNLPTSVVENEYWRLLSSVDNNVSVEYGADIHTPEHGTGFPTRDHITSDDAEMRKYALSKWNLNNIPVIESSAYSHIGINIPGVTTPWMYIGMCFSTFCWHIEDHWSYSINYLHWGEPKTWYSIPSNEADAFELIMKELVPELIGSQPDLLHDLSTTVNPNLLTARGLTVFRTDQNAGEFVVTFPRAYHAGFNQGFNFAEAVNFAPADWIPIGRQCIDHYASLFHMNVFSHDELICKLASNAKGLEESLRQAALEDMITMLVGESAQRKLIKSAGVLKHERLKFENIVDDARQCTHCKATCFLSAVECSCQPKLFCSKDFDKVNTFCSCPPSNLTFKYRYTADELLNLIKSLDDKRTSAKGEQDTQHSKG